MSLITSFMNTALDTVDAAMDSSKSISRIADGMSDVGSNLKKTRAVNSRIKAHITSPAASAVQHVQAVAPPAPPVISRPGMQHAKYVVTGTMVGDEGHTIPAQIQALFGEHNTTMLDNREAIDLRRLKGRMRS